MFAKLNLNLRLASAHLICFFLILLDQILICPWVQRRTTSSLRAIGCFPEVKMAKKPLHWLHLTFPSPALYPFCHISRAVHGREEHGHATLFKTEFWKENNEKPTKWISYLLYRLRFRQNWSVSAPTSIRPSNTSHYRPMM